MTSEPGTNPAATGHEPGASAAPGRQAGGVSLQEAALQLDVSERTVRRLIRDGSVQAYKQKAARGFVWRVVLDPRPADQPSTEARQDGNQAGTSPAHAPEPTGPPTLSAPELLKALEIIEQVRREHEEARRELEARVDRLQQETTEKAEKIAELTGTAAHWQARALIAEDRVKMLMAPKEEPESAVVTPQEAPTQADSAPDWQAIAQTLEERIKRLEAVPDEPTPATVDEGRPRAWWQLWRR